MSTLYIVVGHTGKYEDATTWYVGASKSVIRANALCDKLNAWCKEKGFGPSHNGYVRSPEKPVEDPQFICFDGTSYTVEEVDDLDDCAD